MPGRLNAARFRLGPRPRTLAVKANRGVPSVAAPLRRISILAADGFLERRRGRVEHSREHAPVLLLELLDLPP